MQGIALLIIACLKSVTPVLRAGARQGLSRAGQPPDQAEDIVQDILLAVHLKRQTWDADAPFAPWLFAIARNKLIDALRRRGRRVFVNIDDFAETIPSEPPAETLPTVEISNHLADLAAAAARRVAIDRGGERIDQDDGVEIVDDRRRRARGVASRAREPRSQAAKGLIMDTDRLIQTLAADNDQRPRPVSTQLAMACWSRCRWRRRCCSVTLGIRPDFMSAMRNPFFDTKFLVTLALAIPAIVISVHLSRPEASLGRWVWLLLLSPFILRRRIDRRNDDAATRADDDAHDRQKFDRCASAAIPLLSLPILGGALIALRHGAPSRPALPVRSRD